jgi:hypothetical protein
MDHSNFYECFTTGGRPLVVLGQPPAAVEPAERSLDDPSLRKKKVSGTDITNSHNRNKGAHRYAKKRKNE